MIGYALPLLMASCASAPGFVPRPQEAYEGFSAMADPKADVPVGAVWVQGYGPYGEAAAADNLITIRSLSGFTATSDLQLSLTLGLGSLLHIDPQYRTKISARFTDLSVVRVKDVSKLSGPVHRPRVYEALKAGTITVTADKSVGLDFDSQLRKAQVPVLGRGDTGRTQSLTIDGKDLFLAFRVVTPLPIRSRARTARIGPAKDGGGEAMVNGYHIRLEPLEGSSCPAKEEKLAAAGCSTAGKLRIALSNPGIREEPAVSRVWDPASEVEEVLLPLPLPVAVSGGGLYTAIALRLQLSRGQSGRNESGGQIRYALVGEALRPFPSPQARSW